MKLTGSYQINLEKQKVWDALNDSEVLKKANITLGQTYPLPMVDIKQSRQKALESYSITKEF